MWVHMVIFAVTFGLLILKRAGWIQSEILKDKQGIRLFLAVAVCCNLLGMLFSLKDGAEEYSDGLRLRREETGAYEQEYTLFVDGKEEGMLHVQVPQKEVESEEEESVMEDDSDCEKMKEFQEMLEQYNQDKQDPEYFHLPSKWKGHDLEWEKPKEHTGELFASLGLFSAFLILIKKAKEKQQEEIRRTEQMLMDYPGIIMKFALLIQAGMTARRAFQKIAADYKKRKGKRPRLAYEAIVTTCNEMDSGVAELEAYRRFGERCSQMKYRMFSTLLIQNLQKGSRRLADLLEKEALDAWDERKRKARVLGETAATRLLLPMVMMLAVVMAVIMIPAFLTFYG